DSAIIDGVRWTFGAGKVAMQKRTLNPIAIYAGFCSSPSLGGWGWPFDVTSYMDGRRLYKWQRAKLVRFVRDAPFIKEQLEACTGARIKRAAARRLATLPEERDKADARAAENLEVVSN